MTSTFFGIKTIQLSLPYRLISKVLGASKSFRTGRLERELQMVELSATRCSFIAILWVSPVSFAAITLRWWHNDPLRWWQYWWWRWWWWWTFWHVLYLLSIACIIPHALRCC